MSSNLSNRKLEPDATIRLLQYILNGVLSPTGFISPLKFYPQEIGPEAQTAYSLYSNLLQKMNFQEALRAASPQLPEDVIRALEFGGNSSTLDYVIENLISILQSESPSFSHYLKELEQKTLVVTCGGCFDSEIEKLLKRAELESPSEILISFKNGFVKQTFVCTKIITIEEMASEIHLNSLKKTIEMHAHKTDSPFAIQMSDNPSKFIVTVNDHSILLKFIE